MTSKYIRSLALLLCAASWAACLQLRRGCKQPRIQRCARLGQRIRFRQQ